MNENMSPADVAAVVGNTDRNIGYGYPVFPYAGGFGGNNGFGGDSGWLWLIIILALFGGWGNNGNGVACLQSRWHDHPLLCADGQRQESESLQQLRRLERIR